MASDNTLYEPIFNVPPATLALVAINSAVFLLQLYSSENITDRFAFVPQDVLQRPYTLITYQFLHGGWLHLSLNMLGLLAFGSAVERLLGIPRYLLLYIVCGIGAALVNLPWTDDMHSMIGASGAIAGLMGFVLMRLQRRGRAGMIIVTVASMWLAGEIGFAGIDAPIAWVAHIGGFMMGIAMALFYRGGVKSK